jgi:S-(hydroxymethyl)glutathione dehydrogenase/alcohol dehydrogenase
MTQHNLPRVTEAAILHEPGRPLKIEELELPDLQPGQVLVEIQWAGLCQTQLLEVSGKKGPDPYLPHALGHEGAGRVLAVAAGSPARFKPGDPVALSWIKGPGVNAPGPKYRSRAGHTVNAGQVATFMKYAVVSENRCTLVPENLPLRSAALLGCAVPTGAGIVFNQFQARAGQSIAVVGVGGIGLSAVLAARKAGCSPIVAVDIRRDKLELASKLGASHVIDASAQDPVAAVRGIATEGVDFAIEASGAQKAMETAFQMVRPGGGRLMIAGNLAHGERISIDPFDLIRGKQIQGTAGGQSAPDQDLPRYAKWNLEGIFPFEGMIGREFPLGQVNDAIEALRGGVPGRVMLRIG